MSEKTFEFDVEVRVRKRLHFGGPETRELAHETLKQALEGGMAPNLFAKYGEDGRPIETIISNDFIIYSVDT